MNQKLLLTNEISSGSVGKELYSLLYKSFANLEKLRLTTSISYGDIYNNNNKYNDLYIIYYIRGNLKYFQNPRVNLGKKTFDLYKRDSFILYKLLYNILYKSLYNSENKKVRFLWRLRCHL